MEENERDISYSRNEISAFVVDEFEFSYEATKISFSHNPGVKKEFCTITSTFLSFFHFKVITYIVGQTDRYAQQYIKSRILQSRSSIPNMGSVIVGEMYLYLALLMLMGIVQQSMIKSYFGKDLVKNTYISQNHVAGSIQIDFIYGSFSRQW